MAGLQHWPPVNKKLAWCEHKHKYRLTDVCIQLYNTCLFNTNILKKWHTHSFGRKHTGEVKNAGWPQGSTGFQFINCSTENWTGSHYQMLNAMNHRESKADVIHFKKCHRSLTPTYSHLPTKTFYSSAVWLTALSINGHFYFQHSSQFSPCGHVSLEQQSESEALATVRPQLENKALIATGNLEAKCYIPKYKFPVTAKQ